MLVSMKSAPKIPKLSLSHCVTNIRRQHRLPRWRRQHQFSHDMILETWMNFWTGSKSDGIFSRSVDCIDHQTVLGHILLNLSLVWHKVVSLKDLGWRKKHFALSLFKKSVYTCNCYIKGLSDVLKQRNRNKIRQFYWNSNFWESQNDNSRTGI